MEHTYDALFFGEPLIRFSPAGGCRLQDGGALSRYAGGAELNVAAGLAQLGEKSAYCTKLPDHALSRFLLGQAKARGVSLDQVIFDRRPEARLGVYYYEGAHAPARPSVVYDRKNTSVASIVPEEIPEGIFDRARLFHTTGITLGIGRGPRETAVEMIRRFRENGAKISFDINYRANLWTDQEEREAVEPLLPLLDILFISEESLRRMFGRTGDLPVMMRAFAREYGISYLLSTIRTVRSPIRHEFTSMVYDRETDHFYTEAPYEIEVLDRIGSGDAYVAGALSGLLCADGSPELAMRRGNAMAALKCGIAGDLPSVTLTELERIMEWHAAGSKGEMER